MKPTVAFVLLLCAAPLCAQQRSTPFAIVDNSFLVEEAFNQEAGIFQNILLVQHAGRDWSFDFTQEWPLGGVRHQLSYTIPLEATHDPVADNYVWQRGTVALNYRFQALQETASQPAFSPRLSVLIPVAPTSNGYGLQLNLPASKQFGDFYVHANAGYTYQGINADDVAQRATNLAGSVIYRAWPMVHLVLESVFQTNEFGSANSLVVAPGVRAGFNFGPKQLVLDASIPFGLLANDNSRSLLTYFSYELPF